VNQFLTQYFVTRNFEHGWFLTSSPILMSNWRAPANNQWLIPFGGGFGKMTKFFDQPMVWADACLLQRRPSTGLAVPQVARPTAGGSALSDSEKMNGSGVPWNSPEGKRVGPDVYRDESMVELLPLLLAS
jgi:hypothetical protein